MPTPLLHVTTFALLLIALAPMPSGAQTVAPTTTPGLAAGATMPPVTDAIAEPIAGVVAAGETVKLLTTDVTGGDGIIGLSNGDVLFMETRTGRIRRITPDGQIATLLEAKGVKSIGADRQDRVIALLQDSLEIVYPAREARVLAAGSAAHSLRGLNDFVVSSRGGIYASDVGVYNQPKYSQPTKIHYVPPGGPPRVVADTAETMALPNGIVLSPDEKTLYVADSRNNSGMAWDVRPDGTLANPRAHGKNRITPAMERDFALQANGLAVDAAGRVYAGMPFGVQVFSAAGTYLGTIPAPGKIQSVSFGGPRKEYLYFLSTGAVWRVKMLARGIQGRAK
ncbi:MAG: SMP-30/gluconolactonase/LRE family protein [Vicinamibacterales bacterium]